MTTKTDLTDEELLLAAGEHARLTKLNKHAYVLPETIELARLASAAATEVIAARRRERRLLEWADQLEANRDKPGDVGKFIAAELRNRMVWNSRRCGDPRCSLIGDHEPRNVHANTSRDGRLIRWRDGDRHDFARCPGYHDDGIADGNLTRCSAVSGCGLPGCPHNERVKTT